VVETLQGGRQATASAPGMRPPEELTRALEDVQRLLKAGKQKKVAIVACMRKLLVIINVMVRDGKQWKYLSA